MVTTMSTPTNGADRLRDAALALFADRGYAATTVRAVAERAGVTSGLVVHHYGTKAALRDAVDRYVLTSITTAFGDVAAITRDDDHLAIRLQGFRVLFQERPYMGRYIRRSLLESTDGANALFDQIVAVSRQLFVPLRTAGLVKPTDDPDAQVLLAMLVGMLPALLPRQIERHLGISLRSDDGLQRWTRAEYAFLTHGVLNE
jgi:AcrR family transcriptional regulator